MARTIAGGRWIASAMARVIVGGCVLLAATAASASPFVNLDRQDIGSAGGADLTYFVLDSGDGTLLRLEPHGHYVDPGSNVGGYLTMPIAFFSGDSESGTALGDLEVGAIYAPVVGESTVILHGGVALPTSREGNDDAFVGVVAGYLRPHDIFTTFPETTTVRTGVSPIFRSGKGVFRIDIGVDVPLDVPEGFDPYAMVHINFGGSYQVTETAAVNVELVTGRFLGDNDNDTISAAGLGMRFWTGNLSPYFSFVLPLDDEISNIIDVGVTLGLEATL